MKAIQTLHSIRPASGRALVRVSYCDGDKRGMLPKYPSYLLNQRPYSMQSPQADLWIGDCEDRVPPGGGSA